MNYPAIRQTIGAMVAALALAWPAVSSAETKFKCSTGTLNDVQHEWCKRLVERLDKRTNGALKGEVFPAAQLGGGTQQIAGVQLGTIEMYMVPPEFLVGVDPRFMILTAPYLFNGFDHAYRVLNDEEFRSQFLSMGDNKGYKGVSLLVYGPVGVAARSPIHAPDDLKGKKIRINATPIEQAMMDALGATGVPMGLVEAVTAIQQGVVDGVQSGLPALANFKIYDMAKYHSNTAHFFVTSIGVVSKRWFDRLPADMQKAIVEEGKAVQAELLDVSKQANDRAIEAWKTGSKDGWIELTEAERAAFRKRIESTDAQVVAKHPQIKELLSLLRRKAQALQ